MPSSYDFTIERQFTRLYKQLEGEHTANREASCLELMYPAIFQEIQSGDVFAGRIRMSLVGFSPEPGGLGYYCDTAAIRQMLEENDYPPALQREMEELLAFWAREQTSAKVRSAYPEDVAAALPSDRWAEEPLAAAPLYRMAGSYLDYEKLLALGLPGLQDLVAKRRATAVQKGEEPELFGGMTRALRLLVKCCLYYRDMALEKLEHAADPKEKANLIKMADTLQHITERKPETLQEAMQLHWLYALISGTYNYGRLDVVFGDFLARDIEAHILTMETAQELFNGLWQLMADRKTIWTGRVILGGKGRRNEKNADLAAMLAMEATRAIKDVEPQLSLRIYHGMDERMLTKALAVIGEGRTYPMLYNDEVNIPAVSNAFRIDADEAGNYVPFGCGEYVIDHKSYGSPNGVINLLKILEITLHNGRDGLTGELVGLQTGEFQEFAAFDDLWNAYIKQVNYFVRALAVQEVLAYQITGETAPFLYLSMLYDDCIERGKGIFSGGIKYLGGTLETYGNINTADSLTAINELVYRRKCLSHAQLLEALDADFIGHEKERQLLRRAPKYGNDNAVADSMAVRVHEQICNSVRKQAVQVGLDSYLVVIINNSANTTMGKLTAASADGRGKGLHMANGNNPWGGNDQCGLTAMLNSLVKLTPELHAGAVQNMKFSPELFQNDGKLVRSVLKSYFDNGGAQAMISVVNRGDLEQAMEHPEQYGYLFVRVGGFSARFVELERAVQLEILSRTLY